MLRYLVKPRSCARAVLPAQGGPGCIFFFLRGGGRGWSNHLPSLCRRKQISFCTPKPLTQWGKAAPLAQCKSGTTQITPMGSFQIYCSVSKSRIWPPIPWDEHQPSPLPPGPLPGCPCRGDPAAPSPGTASLPPPPSRVVSPHTHGEIFR